MIRIFEPINITRIINSLSYCTSLSLVRVQAFHIWWNCGQVAAPREGVVACWDNNPKLAICSIILVEYYLVDWGWLSRLFYLPYWVRLVSSLGMLAYLVSWQSWTQQRCICLWLKQRLSNGKHIALCTNFGRTRSVRSKINLKKLAVSRRETG